MTEATRGTSVSTDWQGPDAPIYTAAEMLEVALAAYERGRDDAITDRNRRQWHCQNLASRFRAARITTETTWMRATAENSYQKRGLPEGYQYRGGPVDWDTSMPEGSACAWLRRKRHTIRAAA